MRLLTGTEVSPRTVIRKKIADAKEEEKTDAKKRTLAVVLVIVVCSVVLASVLANWTGRFSRGGQSERQIEFHDEPPAVRTHPKILTVFASKNHDALLKFKSPLHDMVLFDYSKDQSTVCEWCVYAQRAQGVKWQLLDKFLSSDWWQQHRNEYLWLWYPDDDLLFEPGDMEIFLQRVLSTQHFQLMQASLCIGSKYFHPEYLQDKNIKVPIVHIHTVELQMPIGRVQWWIDNYDKGLLKGQRFGYAIDLVWGQSIRNEIHVGVVNEVCALHPFRPPTPTGEKHISGLDDNSLGLTDHDLWLEYKANKAKYGVDYGKKPEYRYFARYVEEARMAYDGVCSGACTGEDEQCFGSTTAVDYCLQGEASRHKNVDDVVERTCTRHIDAETGGARRQLLKKKKTAVKARAAEKAQASEEDGGLRNKLRMAVATPEEEIEHKHAVLDGTGGVVGALRSDGKAHVGGISLGNPDKIQQYKQSLSFEPSDLHAFAAEAEAAGAGTGAAGAGLSAGMGAFGGGAGDGAGGNRPVCCLCIVPDLSGYGKTGQGQHKNAHKDQGRRLVRRALLTLPGNASVGLRWGDGYRGLQTD